MLYSDLNRILINIKLLDPESHPLERSFSINLRLEGRDKVEKSERIVIVPLNPKDPLGKIVLNL